MKKQYTIFCLLVFFLFGAQLKAEVTLPAVISDNMVLQQDVQARIWGKADAKEKIKVTTSWDKKVYETSANEAGKWQVKVQTPKQSSRAEHISIKGKNALEVKNILIGEVWMCSGQSNMDFQVAKEKGWKTGIIDEEKEMQDADYSEIRLFHIAQKLSPKAELDDCEGQWLVCNAENLKTFSAVAYFFGKDLHQKLHAPIGLIQASWGATHAESWTKMSEMEHDPVYADLVYDFYQSRDNYDSDLKNYEEELSDYNKKVSDGVEGLKKPKKPNGIYHHKALSTLWNSMIHPVLPYAIRGAIWYQGESNSIRHEDYRHVFTKMINSWRKEWGQGDFPFYFVQIAPHYKQPPQIREAQLETWQTVPNTGMVVIPDAADSTDIHPRWKQIPGERLAKWALAKTYDKKIAFSGPRYKSHEVRGNQVIVSFDYTDGGLKSNDNKPLIGFCLAGADKVFHLAKVEIEGDKLVLSTPEVASPMAIRYNWDKFFRANFFNGAGLPATPFRTDRWVDKVEQ